MIRDSELTIEKWKWPGDWDQNRISFALSTTAPAQYLRYRTRARFTVLRLIKSEIKNWKSLTKKEKTVYLNLFRFFLFSIITRVGNGRTMVQGSEEESIFTIFSLFLEWKVTFLSNFLQNLKILFLSSAETLIFTFFFSHFSLKV